MMPSSMLYTGNLEGRYLVPAMERWAQVGCSRFCGVPPRSLVRLLGLDGSLKFSYIGRWVCWPPVGLNAAEVYRPLSFVLRTPASPSKGRWQTMRPIKP